MSDFNPEELAQQEQENYNKLRDEIINNQGLEIIDSSISTDLSLRKITFWFRCPYSIEPNKRSLIDGLDASVVPVASTTSLIYKDGNMAEIKCQLY